MYKELLKRRFFIDLIFNRLANFEKRFCIYFFKSVLTIRGYSGDSGPSAWKTKIVALINLQK